MSSPTPAAPPIDPSVVARRFGAALVFAGWLFLVGSRTFSILGEALVALAVAVVVPLGLAVVSREETAPRRLARRVVGALAPFGLASFVFPAGPLAALLAGLWLVATCMVALAGLRRLLVRRGGPLEELAIDLGHLYLPVGGAWLFASRAGMSPMGFQEPIVLYTAAHFHYAGFAAPVIVGLVGRELGASDPSAAGPASRFFYKISAVVVLLGVPLVAAGITISHALEAPSAALLGFGMVLLAMFAWLVALRRLFSRGEGRAVLLRRVSALPLFVAGLSLVGSMFLAVAFTATGSAGRGAGEGLVPLSTMVTYHGVANAIGFATMALLAFAISPPPDARKEPAKAAPAR